MVEISRSSGRRPRWLSCKGDLHTEWSEEDERTSSLYIAVCENEDRALAFRVDLIEAIEYLFDAGAAREASALVRILQGATQKEAALAEKLDRNQVARAMAFLRGRLRDYEEGL
jgi:hypothetical protein